MWSRRNSFLCSSTAPQSLSRSRPLVSQSCHCGFFFSSPPFFCNEVLKSTRSTETETASPAKRLFIGKVEWWPVCRSNNISKLLSPAVRGVQPICASKGQVRLECCLRSRVPSLPGHHPPNSVTHTGNGSVVRVQSAFPPTYNTWHVRNVVRSILKWETHKRGVGVIFFFLRLSLSHLLMPSACIQRSFIFSSPFLFMATEMILLLLYGEGHICKLIMVSFLVYSGVKDMI